MYLRTEFIIALKYLQAKKKEAMISVTAILSLVGIMLGVAALVVVISVMNGYRIELISKLKGFNSEITVTPGSGLVRNYNKVIDKIYSASDVKSVFPIIEDQALIAKGKSSRGIMVKALSRDKISEYPVLHDVSENPKAIRRSNGILLGASLAHALNIKKGDVIKLVSTEFTSTILGAVPTTKDFYVEGVFKSGLNDYDSIYAFILLEMGQPFFNLQGAINKFEVFTKGLVDVHQSSLEVSRKLKGDYIVKNWQSINKFLFNALRTERTVMFIILTFIIIVAVFNIVSSLTMLVTDKAREVAILRTIGFTKGSIMRIFLFCGMLLGGGGTLLGVTLGVLFASHINEIKDFVSNISGTNLFDPIVYYLEVLPAHVEGEDVLMISGIALIASMFATLYPSYKASRISPAQGLKND